MYLVIFRNRKRADIDYAAYEADSAVMLDLAQAQPGYLSFKSYTADDGEVIALSEWADRDAAHAWGRLAEHVVVQGRGRASYYESYTLFGCDSPRIHEYRHKEQS